MLSSARGSGHGGRSSGARTSAPSRERLFMAPSNPPARRSLALAGAATLAATAIASGVTVATSADATAAGNGHTHQVSRTGDLALAALAAAKAHPGATRSGDGQAFTVT